MNPRARNDQHMPPTPPPALDMPITRERFFENHVRTAMWKQMLRWLGRREQNATVSLT